MFRTIMPDNGYCLFFPNRKEGRRFEAGRSVRVWRWEEWKHIKLGQFSVALPDPEKPELITTSEDLECEVRGDFKIVVGGPPEGIEERLKRATISVPPSRDIKKKVEFDFFQAWAANYCRTSIARVIRQCSYIRLVEDADYRAEAIRKVEGDAKQGLEVIGLILIRSTIVIDPLEPKSALVTKEILDKWLAFRKTLDAAERAKRKAQHEDEQLLADLDREHAEKMKEIEQQEKEKAREIEEKTRINIIKIEAAAELEEQEEARAKDAVLQEIRRQMADLQKDAQIMAVGRDAEIEEARIRKEEALEEIQRGHEFQASKHRQEMEDRESRHRQEMEERESQHRQEMEQHRLEMLRLEYEANQKELESIKLKEEVSRIRTELERVSGQVKAKIIEQETLARSAASIKMREILLQSLPQIAAEVNRPLEKMGEIRVNLVGTTDSAEQGGFLQGLWKSTSIIPLIKEALRLVRDFESESRDSHRSREEGAFDGHRLDPSVVRMGKAHSDVVTGVEDSSENGFFEEVVASESGSED
jgi:hypothetical protein